MRDPFGDLALSLRRTRTLCVPAFEELASPRFLKLANPQDDELGPAAALGATVAALGSDLRVQTGLSGHQETVSLCHGTRTFLNPNPSGSSPGSGLDGFGVAVAFVGSDVLVGARGEDGVSAAYLSERTTGRVLDTFGITGSVLSGNSPGHSLAVLDGAGSVATVTGVRSHVSRAAGGCGNGVLDRGEECDGGHDAEGDCGPGACGLEPVQHLDCYWTRTRKGAPKCVPIDVRVAGAYPNVQANVRKQDTVCLSVDKDGEGIEDSNALLICYKTKNLGGEPGVRKIDTIARDPFGELTLSLSRARTLCVRGSPASWSD